MKKELITEEEKSKLVLSIEIGDESTICALVNELIKINKNQTLDVLLGSYEKSENRFPRKVKKLLEIMISAEKIPIDFLLRIYKIGENADICFLGQSYAIEQAIAEFMSKISLEYLVKIFEHIPNGTFVGIRAHNSFNWKGVKLTTANKKLCQEIVGLISENRERMCIINEMLRKKLINISLALSAIKAGLQKTSELPLGSDMLIMTIAERKINNSKDVLLKAIRRIVRSNYIGQDMAARKLIECLDLTNNEIAELVRDLYYPLSETAEVVKVKIGTQPTDELIKLLVLGKKRMVNCLTLPSSASELVCLVKNVKKLCDSDTVAVFLNKLTPKKMASAA